MKGENPEEPLSNDPKEFGSRSVGIRAAIVAAGSVMNFILPFLLLPLVYLLGIHIPTFLEKQPTLYWVANGSAADDAGLQIGDTLTSVNGIETSDWKILNFTLLTESQQEQAVPVSFERDGETSQTRLSLTPDSLSMGAIGLFHDMKPTVGGVMSDSPASRASLQPGDRIKKIAQTPIQHWIQMSEIIEQYPGTDLAFLVERNDQEVSLTIKPDARIDTVSKKSPAERAGLQAGDIVLFVNNYDTAQWIALLSGDGFVKQETLSITVSRDGKDSTFTVEPREAKDLGITISGKIGIVPHEETIFRRYGFIASIREGFNQAIEMTVLTLKTLWKLVTLNMSLKMLGGPIVIAKMTGSAAKSGIASLLVFTALLSLNLSIINLLPIPVLDGGHLFFLLVELILRKPLDTKKMELVQKIGLALLILIFLTVTYNDILRTVPHKYLDFLPWK
jgi:regulator of sigma E protease